MADAGDISSRIQLLIKAVGEDPDSFEDWWMLARSYSAIGDHASAADAYRNASNLADDRPGVLSAYAEAMTLANGNKVPSAARVIFEQLARDNADPRARYYIALAKAQSQNFEAAIADWVALANDSRFGLGSGVFTENVARAHRVSARIRSGIVWVNTYRAISPIAPFGGFGMSGYGRECGEEGLRAYTENKTVTNAL